jgi:hypothetical protein
MGTATTSETTINYIPERFCYFFLFMLYGIRPRGTKLFHTLIKKKQLPVLWEEAVNQDCPNR